jgi:hypothetical protein
MNETINNPPTAPIERQRMDMDIVGVGFDPTFSSGSQFATLKPVFGTGRNLRPVRSMFQSSNHLRNANACA